MTNLTRNSEVCLSRLMETKDGKVLTKAPCRIQIPERWVDKGLANISSVVSVFGFFPIIFEDNVYSVMNVCGLIDIKPTSIGKVKIDEDPYIDFIFDGPTTLIDNVNIVKQDTITYNVLEELFIGGKVPWWCGIHDLCCIFDTADIHAGSNIGAMQEIIEFISGVVCRKKDNMSVSIRHGAESQKDIDLDRIEFVPLMSVLYSVNNTTAKLSGSYFQDGVVSAIVNPASRVSKVERILRT